MPRPDALAEALPLLDQALERVAPGSRVIFHALVLTELSEALLLVGRLEEAGALARHLLELSRTHIGPRLPGACLPSPRRGRHAS